MRIALAKPTVNAHHAGTIRAIAVTEDAGVAVTLGLAASAPYFYDGSAPTLAALLRDRGLVHGMTDTTRASTEAQISDLTAFLESL